MADPLTHSHDTSTPALSVESEYVLVPREPTLRMVEIGYNVVDWCKTYTMDGETDPARVWRAMWDAVAPAHNPSPAAKGGEAVREAEEIADKWRDLALQFDAHRIQALSWLKAMVADAETHKAGASGFLASPPLSGEKVLADRIAALATPSPQPAGAVREALKKISDEASKANDVIRLNRDGGGQGRVKVATAMHRIAEWSRAALAPDPTPAGEAVEARPACDWPGCIGEGRPCACDERADERLARLREDLERVTRELEEEAALRVGAIDRMKAAERERDDAWKALETGDVLFKRCLLALKTTIPVYRELENLIKEHLAARSASREGASDE